MSGAFLVVLTLLAPAGLLLMEAPSAEAAKVTTEAELPSKRVGSSAVHVGDGVFFIFGGRAERTTYLDEIVRYDSRSGESSVVGRLPIPVGFTNGGRQSMAAAYDGSKVYLFGGAAIKMVDVNGDGTPDPIPTSLSDIVEFDPATSEARTLPTDRLPRSSFGTTAVAYQNNIWLFGGFTFDIASPETIGRRDWILTFTPGDAPGARVRQPGFNLPFANQDMATVLVDKTVWLLGGLGTNNTANPCTPFEGQDPETGEATLTYPDSCTTKRIVTVDLNLKTTRRLSEEIPQGLQFSSGALVKDRIYIFGGRLGDGSASSHIVSVNPSTREVGTLFPTLPAGRFGMPAVSDGEVIRLFGGRDGGQFTNGVPDVLKFDTRPSEPFAPRKMEAVTTADGAGVRVSWEPPNYDGGTAIERYHIYRLIEGGVRTRLTTVTSALSHVDKTAEPGQAYVYLVTAENAAGESQPAQKSTQAATRPPGVPVGFQAFAGDGFAVLRWLAPATNGGSDIGAYRIYRGDDTKPLGETAPDALEYRDAAVTNGETYSYRVSAVNGKGEGEKTEARSVTPAQVPNAPASLDITEEGEALSLSWSAAGGGVTGYQLYKGTEPDHLAPFGEVITETKASDPLVERGRLYYYAVAGQNQNGEGAWSKVTSGGLIQPPSPPLNLLLTAGPARMDLTWQPPRDFGGADKVTYLVKRTGPDGTERIIANGLTAAKYTDTTVFPGLDYTYRIAASNGRIGLESTPKTKTPLEVTNEAPVAALTVVGSTTAAVGEPVSFDASLSSDPDGRVVKYEFDWGDSSRATSSDVPQVSHTFQRDGCFTVKMHVVDDRQEQSAKPAQVHINVGTCGLDDDGRGDANTIAPPTVNEPPPGTEKPKSFLPGPSPFLVLLGIVAVAFFAARRRTL